jgi:hypothetical protein
MPGISTGERFLSGISGGRLVKGGKQYGLFANDSRLFGVRDTRSGGYLRETLVMSPVEGGVFSNLRINGTAINLRKVEEKSEAILSKLEEKNDLVLAKGQIRSLELEKPGLISNGYLRISIFEEKPIKVRIYGKDEFELVCVLMGEFYPEVLKRL